ncbi:TetR/AcrR family transcriptional regulator [Roseivivax sp. CAU 1761]
MKPVKENKRHMEAAAPRSASVGGRAPRDRFLASAREILAQKGLKGLTFDAVANRLGVSKQAVIHWYPTKSHLLAALVLPDLKSEADTVIEACRNSAEAPPLRAPLEALIAHHLSDLERFRMLYFAPQASVGIDFKTDPAVAAEIHRITGEMYASLAACVGDEGDAARRTAVSVHASAIGILTMVSLGQSIGDPLKHGGTELVESLIDLISTSDGA